MLNKLRGWLGFHEYEEYYKVVKKYHSWVCKHKSCERCGKTNIYLRDTKFMKLTPEEWEDYFKEVAEELKDQWEKHLMDIKKEKCWTNGDYLCKCYICHEMYYGPKKCPYCKECASPEFKEYMRAFENKPECDHSEYKGTRVCPGCGRVVVGKTMEQDLPE